MQRHEYTVTAAPDRGQRAKDAKTPTDRYALALAGILNDMAAEGWEYVRAETLPSDERSGIASRQTLWHNVLVFRRALPDAPSVDSVAPHPTRDEDATPAPAAPPAQAAPPAPSSTPAGPPANQPTQKPTVTEDAATPPLRRKEATTEPASGPRLGPAAR